MGETIRKEQGPEMVTCDACGYHGAVETYNPTLSPYTDIRCPQCGSTNNEHNREYLRQLQANMKP